MPFYYPLTLGARQRTLRPQNRAAPFVPQPYDTWREGVERLAYAYEEYPEAQVLEAMQRLAPTQGSRFWLILGEPGAGKTTLLETWFTRWATQLSAPLLGEVVPVLVRLRDVQAEQTPQDNEEFADLLWALGRSEQALLEGQGASIYRRDRGRCFQPVWLFDGLDELSPPPDERFYQALVNLQGLKVVSCRTAVYEIFHREVDRYKEQEYELLGLKSRDQHAFLTHALNGDTRRAKVLHDRLQHNSQLRLLAGNPLMLSLIAQVSDPMALPATRSVFYRAAVSELWRRRLAHHPDADFRTRERDQVLTELAERMGMVQIQAPLAWLEEAANHAASPDGRWLMRYLQHAGIVRPHSWEKVEFVHLTFQEFYLAQALKQSMFQKVLEHYWHNPRYEETLGLLVSLLSQDKQYADIDQGIRWLVKWGEDTHRQDPRVLWQHRRSPLRVTLHLLHRASVSLEHLPSTAGVLWEKISRSIWRQWAVVKDVNTPPSILKQLAQDAIEPMRQFIAANPNTPSNTLARLTRHANPHIRWQAARHPSTPPETLAQLAQAPDSYMRWIVAGNPSTPPETLSRLAQDTGSHVRQGTLLDLLARRAGDIHRAVAGNPGTPLEVRAQLARDTVQGMHRAVTGELSAPPEATASLASHANPNMRRRAAINLNTPSETLAHLAQDVDRFVRQAVAANPNTSPDILTQLAQDTDPHVRRDVAINASAPPELLAQLAQDADTDVHWSVAMNTSTLLEDL